LVQTARGTSTLAAMRDDDRVVSFYQHSSAIVGLRNGYKVKVGRRSYCGKLYGVTTPTKQSWSSAAGVSASLIWLPVAAVLAWLDDHGDSLPMARSQSDERLSVLVVHADWGRIRCSTLNLVVRAKEFGCRWIAPRFL
jgi:hypothetical protein